MRFACNELESSVGTIFNTPQRTVGFAKSTLDNRPIQSWAPKAPKVPNVPNGYTPGKLSQKVWPHRTALISMADHLNMPKRDIMKSLLQC